MAGLNIHEVLSLAERLWEEMFPDYPGALPYQYCKFAHKYPKP